MDCTKRCFKLSPKEEELKALHSAVEEQKAEVEEMRADAEKNKENIKVPSTPSLPKTPVRNSNVRMTPKGSTQKVMLNLRSFELYVLQ